MADTFQHPCRVLTKTQWRTIGLCLLLIITNYTSFAAQTATRDAANTTADAANTVHGQITDATGASVANASIVLRNLSTGLERVAQTDADGRFAFAGVRAGDRYEVTASARGFARAEREVTIGDGEIVLTLEPAPLVEQTVVVSGSRQEELRESLNTKVDVVTRNRIRDTGYETVGEALREVPGVL
ncbi:MAG: carboxypeptidase regulatory-like domain-containing protein, partial [Pyrinomonadaceae bacterium MAG19_C2-C3]|nr:carboxypeptidase regulatory-like domain-containing protein [Pyrinomonadaceae bacterium MAG19_C2-C3]